MHEQTPSWYEQNIPVVRDGSSLQPPNSLQRTTYTQRRSRRVFFTHATTLGNKYLLVNLLNDSAGQKETTKNT